MEFVQWMAGVGGLLLAMALSSAWIQRLPISSAAIYLLIGCVIGPWGLELLKIDLVGGAWWLERVTEIAVILSLFIGGLRLRLPLLDSAWRSAYLLASLGMLATIAGTAACAMWLFDLDLSLAILLGAILAPTDPVLASAVTVGHAQDNDRMRYALSGEAGLNDGAAFPFVVLGLLLLGSVDGDELFQWAWLRVLWAIPGGLAIGYVLGRVVGRVAIRLRAHHRDTSAPTDFLALALIALAYAAADFVNAWGFLAVFAAGIGLRHAEVRTVESDPHPDAQSSVDAHPPAETLVDPNRVTEREIAQPAVAAGVMVAEVFSFGDTLERLLEVLLVVLVGVSLATHFDMSGVWLGLALIVVIRPLSVWVLSFGQRTSVIQRSLVAWFGIRGIGSLYYLAYSVSHGLGGAPAADIASITLTVIAMSIVVHGTSSQPLMKWYEREGAGR
jgi:sodium/hydrogen antiporter